MPFPALIKVFQAFLGEGYLYLFKLALGIVEAIESQLLTAQTHTALELLRLDPKHFPDADLAFFERLVARASQMQVTHDDIQLLRDKQWKVLQEKQAQVRAREAQMKEDDDSDGINFSDEDSDEEDEATRLARLAQS